MSESLLRSCQIADETRDIEDIDHVLAVIQEYHHKRPEMYMTLWKLESQYKAMREEVLKDDS